MKKYPIINRILSLTMVAALLVASPIGAYAANITESATEASVSESKADANSQAKADSASSDSSSSKTTTSDSSASDSSASATTASNSSASATTASDSSASQSSSDSSSASSASTATSQDQNAAVTLEDGSVAVDSATWTAKMVSESDEAGSLIWNHSNQNNTVTFKVVDQNGDSLSTDAYSGNKAISGTLTNGNNLSSLNSGSMEGIAKRGIEGYTYTGVYYDLNGSSPKKITNISYNSNGANRNNGWFYISDEMGNSWNYIKNSTNTDITLYIVYNTLNEENSVNVKLFYYSYDSGTATKLLGTKEEIIQNNPDNLVELKDFCETISDYTYDRASVFNTSGKIKEADEIKNYKITSYDDSIWKSSGAGWKDGNIAQQLKLYYDKTEWCSQRVETYVGGEKITPGVNNSPNYSFNPNNNGLAVVFIYEPNNTFDSSRVSTKDSIQINLFDYTISGTDSQSEDKNNDGGINADHNLKFAKDPGKGDGYNAYNASGRTKGILANQLDANGMPSLSATCGDQPLGYLFNTLSGANKRVDEGLDKLFAKDADGYYVFDSDSSFATISGNLATGSKEFKVYKDTTIKGFFPYTSHTLYNGVSNNYGDALGSQSTNHYLGMTIATTFVQPKDGKINGKDMVFEFSGDDDVWVFIDGKLVLDLGGIHGKVSGTINFATGQVTYTGSNSSTITIDETDFRDEEAWSDWSKHTLKMFYLERGHNASNCKIKMNLATIPEGGFILAKDATGVDTAVADDMEYQFVVKDDLDNPCTNLEYTIVGDTSGTIHKTDSENGCFTLKSGQVASFSKDVNNNKTYKIYEVATAGQYASDNPLPYFTTIAKVVYSSADKPSDTKSYAKNATERFIEVSTSATDTPIVVFSNTLDGSSTIKPEDVIKKSAQVKGYDQRTYDVTLQARKTTLDLTGTGSPIDLILVMDTSGSMNFHADLKETNITSIDQMDIEKTYYGILNTSAATVYEIKYKGSTWKYLDDSFDTWDKAKALTKDFFEESLGEKLFTATSERTRFYYFKDTAKKLIDKLPEESKLAVVSFNKSAKIPEINGKDIVTVTNNKDAIKTVIDGLTTDGGTRQDLGLKKAEDLLKKDDLKKTGHNKYVVMVSDGSPNGGKNDDYNPIKNNSIKYRDHILKIVDQNDNSKTTRIYTIGLDTSLHTSDIDYAEEILQLIATNGTSYEGYYHSVTSANLDAQIKSIIASITGLQLSVVITQGQVVDVIDPRFDLYDDSGAKVEKKGTYTIGGHSATVTVDYNGIYTVTWSNQALGVMESDGNVTPWTASFTLKAKEDFLGGNVIATNGAESGVKTGSSDNVKFEKFDQPAVNVKLLDFTLKNEEEYVFKGDKFEVYTDSEAYRWLLDNMTGTGASVIKNLALTSITDMKWSKQGDNSLTTSVDYSYDNTSDRLGTITYTFTPNDVVNGAIDSDGTALKEDTPVATWTLTVSYSPTSEADRLQQDTTRALTLSNNPGAEVVKKEATGTYKDNVATIALKLMKYGNGQNDVKYSLANAEFTLSTSDNIGREDKKTTGDGTDGTTLGLITFADLKTGTYTLKETKAPEGWQLNNTEYTVSINKKTDSSDDAADKKYLYTIRVSHQESDETVTDIDCTVNLEEGKVTDSKDQSIALDELAESDMLQLNVYDQMAYELPHTGGSGVYVYIIGGILLMLVGALLIYKTKNNKNK